MSNKKAPRLNEDALDKFVSAAPDSQATATPAPAASKSTRKTPKPDPQQTIQIALKMSQGDLDQIDDAAAKKRISRSGFIRQAVFEVIRQTG